MTKMGFFKIGSRKINEKDSNKDKEALKVKKQSLRVNLNQSVTTPESKITGNESVRD